MDKRKNNGGNSTKSKKANDKRKNNNRQLLNEYCDSFDSNKLKKLLDKLYNDGIAGDTKSATLFLAYILGKPKEYKEVEITDHLIKVGFTE